LLARRHLSKLNLADKYKGKPTADGEDFNVEANESGPRPFQALLDVGLVRTTTGHRVFAAMKGAIDGGIDIPHSETRFAGYSKEDKKLDAGVLRKYIYGGHIAEYMTRLSSEEPERYSRQFSKFIKGGVKGESLENLYKKAHSAIRADPVFKKSTKPKPAKQVRHKSRKAKLSLAQRKDRVKQRIEAHKKKKAEAE